MVEFKGSGKLQETRAIQSKDKQSIVARVVKVAYMGGVIELKCPTSAIFDDAKNLPIGSWVQFTGSCGTSWDGKRTEFNLDAIKASKPPVSAAA